MNIENYNYWRDPRVIASMVDTGKVIEEDGRRYILLDEEDPIKVLCCWGVCDMCNGNGKHINPSIDCCGLSSEDMDFEDYTSGVYDITCAKCKGLRVVPIVDRQYADLVMLERYDAWMKDEWDSARESAAERSMGA